MRGADQLMFFCMGKKFPGSQPSESIRESDE
jgi:hypothetical protein